MGLFLFDEIEKAHPEVLNLLLQILDDGRCTDSQGRTVDFKNTIIIMTSNLGATALRDEKSVGFGAKDVSDDYEAMAAKVRETLKKTFRPEFLNRLDETVVFHSLNKEEIHQIVKLMAKNIIDRIKEQNINNFIKDFTTANDEYYTIVIGKFSNQKDAIDFIKNKELDKYAFAYDVVDNISITSKVAYGIFPTMEAAKLEADRDRKSVV